MQLPSSRLTLQDFKAQLFKALGHPTRVRILERLRLGEQTVTALQTELAIEGNAVSQQLATLRANAIVVGRKEGTSVYYRVADAHIFVLLDAAREIFTNYVEHLQGLAEDGVPTAAASQSATGADLNGPEVTLPKIPEDTRNLL